MTWGLGRFGDAALSDLLQRGPAMRYRPAARARRLGHCGDISINRRKMPIKPAAEPRQPHHKTPIALLRLPAGRACVRLSDRQS